MCFSPRKEPILVERAAEYQRNTSKKVLHASAPDLLHPKRVGKMPTCDRSPSPGRKLSARGRYVARSVSYLGAEEGSKVKLTVVLNMVILKRNLQSY